MKQILMVLLLTLVFSNTSLANKEVSGGNGVGGTLLDLYSQGQGEPLGAHVIRDTLAKNLPEIYQAYPFFGELVETFIKGDEAKTWYLEDRALNPACANPTTIQTGKVDILACQNDVEVRIKKSWWRSAPDRTKAELLLHEILTAMRFHDKKFGAVPPATYALLTHPGTPETAQTLYALGFGYFYSEQEIVKMDTAFQVFLRSICSVETSKAYQKAVDKFMKIEPSLNQGAPFNRILVVDAVYFTGRQHMSGSILCQADSDLSRYFLWHAWWARYTRQGPFGDREWFGESDTLSK